MRCRLAFLLAVPLALAGSAWAQQAPPTVGITTFVIKGHGWGADHRGSSSRKRTECG